MQRIRSNPKSSIKVKAGLTPYVNQLDIKRLIKLLRPLGPRGLQRELGRLIIKIS